MMNNINITATGGTQEERELVTNVVTRALVDEGFVNVALVNTKGEPMVGNNVPSLLQVIRERKPDFLNTPLRVWSIPAVDMDSFDEPPPNQRAVAMQANEDDGSARTTMITILEGNPKPAPVLSEEEQKRRKDELEEFTRKARAEHEAEIIRRYEEDKKAKIKEAVKNGNVVVHEF